MPIRLGQFTNQRGRRALLCAAAGQALALCEKMAPWGRGLAPVGAPLSPSDRQIAGSIPIVSVGDPDGEIASSGGDEHREGRQIAHCASIGEHRRPRSQRKQSGSQKRVPHVALYRSTVPGGFPPRLPEWPIVLAPFPIGGPIRPYECPSLLRFAETYAPFVRQSPESPGVVQRTPAGRFRL